MSNKYIEIKLNCNNEFKTDVTLSIGSLGINNICNVMVKIDCGCPNSTLPIMRLGLSKELASVQKMQDCSNANIDKEISFGVNDTTDYISDTIDIFKSGNYSNLKEVSFIHHDFTLSFTDDISIYSESIRVNYDRTGNILIGMDILKKLDCHIGKTSFGETVLIACPITHLTTDYLHRLNQLINQTNISYIQ